jgi:anti-sigma factor RsiW
MNRCTESAIQEMLPDLLHDTLAADAMRRVEAHLATCEECREDLKALRTVQGAAVFAPMIDVDRVVRQIPPYQTIVPAIEVPARARRVSWLVAATLAIVIVGGGSLVVMRDNVPPGSTAGLTPEPSVPIITQMAPVDSVTRAPFTLPSAVVATTEPHTPALALAADVDGLSDGDLAQLMDEMNRFDALPASEPEPVISVDSGYTTEQE